jgi:hypothetical protein
VVVPCFVSFLYLDEDILADIVNLGIEFNTFTPRVGEKLFDILDTLVERYELH